MSRKTLLLLLIAVACQNAPKENAGSDPADALPLNTPIDTAYGFKGCERAQLIATSPEERELTYQHYVVRITSNPESVGEKVIIDPLDSGAVTYSIPMDEDAYFYGISNHKAFIDIGTGPDGREVMVFDLQKRVAQFRSAYADTILIAYNNRMWYYCPIDPSEIDSLPDCPGQAEWQAAGLGVGWAERRIYDFGVRSLTRKSEFKCIPLQ